MPAMRLTGIYIIICALLTCTGTHAQQGFGLYTPVLKPSDDPGKVLSNYLFLKTTVSKSSIFIGEPVLVQYKLYMGVLAEPSPGKEPAFSGCSVVQMPPQETPVIETVNGRKYNVINVRKVQLIPLQDGPLVIPEASINNVVEYVTSDNPNAIKEFSVPAASAPLTITVKPLPEKDKPTDFSGLVGNFTIAARVDSNTIPLNDNTHFTLVIRGSGNIGALTLPVINWPGDTEHFESGDTQHTSEDTFPVKGDKIFSIPFIGTKKGQIIIPAVYLNYFDPVAEKYVTIHTDSLPITVTGPLPKSQQKEIVTEDITNRKYLWIVPAIALTVGFVLIITGKKQKDERKKLDAEKEKQRLWEEVKQRAEEAQSRVPAINYTTALRALAELQPDQAFFNRSKELLTKALQQKFSTSSVHENVILAEMKAQNVGDVLYENARHIYKICNLCLYSPVVDEGQRVLVHETLAVMITDLGL